MIGIDALRRGTSAAARTRGFSAGVAAAERLTRRRGGSIAILTYHRVANPDSTPLLDPRLVSAAPGEFRAQMHALARSYDVLSAGDLVAIRRGERSPTRPALVITFDDAYADFAEHAWPVLRELGLPVTLFVPTAFAEGTERAFWWDRVHAAIAHAQGPTVDTPFGAGSVATPEDRARVTRLVQSRLAEVPHDELLRLVDQLSAALDAPEPPRAVLGWDELRSLAGEGVTLAPHTRTHPLLDRVPPDRARAEIRESERDLEREVGTCPRVFAYPGGAYDEHAVAALEQEGFELAMTTERGVNHTDAVDWLRLRRINVGRRSNEALIRAQLVYFSSRRRPRTGPVAAACAATPERVQ